jgi:hypothetical protein
MLRISPRGRRSGSVPWTRGERVARAAILSNLRLRPVAIERPSENTDDVRQWTDRQQRLCSQPRTVPVQVSLPWIPIQRPPSPARKDIAGGRVARHSRSWRGESVRRLAVDRHEPHTLWHAVERTLESPPRPTAASWRQLAIRSAGLKPSHSPKAKHLPTNTAPHAFSHAFLAENDLLLLHPEHGVALSLDNERTGARSESATIEVRGGVCAADVLLREVGRPDDPSLRLHCPPEKPGRAGRRVSRSASRDFWPTHWDGLNHFRQRDAKDEVNMSSERVSADEASPGPSPLFTTRLMVLFFLKTSGSMVDCSPRSS